MSEVKPCFNCNSTNYVPHPKREESLPYKWLGRVSHERHPLPWASFKCENCKEDLLTCDDCGTTTPDWWYDMGEIWEDMHTDYSTYVLCQCCQYELSESD